MVMQVCVMACRQNHDALAPLSSKSNVAPTSPILESNSNSASPVESRKHVSPNCVQSPNLLTEFHRPECDVHHQAPTSTLCIVTPVTEHTSTHPGQVGSLPFNKGIAKKLIHEQLECRPSPNDYIWQKLESLIEEMVSEEEGIPVRTVKSLMSTIPSTFTGNDIVQWLVHHIGADDVTEAVHLASRIASMGYIFCIDDHVLTVKNDNHTYYRFQTPCLYPSRCMEVDTIDYAVYLCKRTMQNKQRLELVDFEAERLASLQTLYCHKWEFVYIQAEAEAKVDKKRDKLERLVLESQERAFWDLHRPPPGCINTTEVDMRKLCRAKRPKKNPTCPSNFPIPSGPGGTTLFQTLDGLSYRECVTKLNASFRTRIRSAKAAETLQNYCDQYSEFDLLLTASSVITGSTGVSASVSTQSGVLAPPANVNLPTTSISACGAASAALGAMSGIAGHPSSVAPLAGGIVTGVHTGSFGSGGSPSTGQLRTGSGTALNLYGVAGPAHVSAGHQSGANADGAQEPASTLNPWTSDNPDYWIADTKVKYLPIRRIKRWSFSIHELLKDPIGRDEFQRWLEKEFSAENLRFWQACQELKGAPLRELGHRVQEIYSQYLAPNAAEPLNVDSRVAETVRRHVTESSGTNPNRYCFEEAEDHIFHLMKSDSYCRFLRSDVYRELFTGVKKKSKKQRAAVNLTAIAGGSAMITSGVILD